MKNKLSFIPPEYFDKPPELTARASATVQRIVKSQELRKAAKFVGMTVPQYRAWLMERKANLDALYTKCSLCGKEESYWKMHDDPYSEGDICHQCWINR